MDRLQVTMHDQRSTRQSQLTVLKHIARLLPWSRFLVSWYWDPHTSQLSEMSCLVPSLAVVLDTNVIVAAGFNRRSASAKIVDAVTQGQLRMVWNAATRREIERILRQIPPLRPHSVSHLFRPTDRCSNATRPADFASIPDPDDREFAALAHAADAILVSNDEHLLRYADRLDATVLTPAMFWRLLQSRSRATEESARTEKSATDLPPAQGLNDEPRRLF